MNDLKKDFSFAFKKAESVILCPIYKAGENLNIKLDYYKFANLIAKKSNVDVFIVNNQYEIAKFLKNYLKP